MKKLKDTKLGRFFKKLNKGVLKKVAGKIINGAMEGTPLSGFKYLFDVDKDGKITFKDIKKIDWLKFSAFLFLLFLLFRYKILNVDDIMSFLGI